MFYIVRVYFRPPDARCKAIVQALRVKADTPSGAMLHVMAQDWTYSERQTIVTLTANIETGDAS